MILKICRTAEFEDEIYPTVGSRRKEKAELASKAIRMTLERPSLLCWLEQVSGCEPLGRVTGWIAEMPVGSSLDWHKDVGIGVRQLAIVINLTEVPYEGGAFELRELGAEPLVRHRHETPGSALIFRLGKHLQHRVLPVTSGGPRRVFAGWFSIPEIT
jgi:hypothetical protein